MSMDWKTCLAPDSEPEEKVLVQTSSQSAQDSCRGDLLGGPGGPEDRGTLTDLMNSEAPSGMERMLSQTESLWQAPPLCLPLCLPPAGMFLWRWNMWILKGNSVNGCSRALLCKWYTNWSLKSGPNDAILLCLPASLTPILRCTVQMLVYYVHQ